jgi:predicted RNase H-like nuclease
LLRLFEEHPEIKFCRYEPEMHHSKKMHGKQEAGLEKPVV